MERPLPQFFGSSSFLPCTPPPLSPTQSLWNKASIARARTPESPLHAGDATVLERREPARADIKDLISPRADIKEAFLLLEKGAERTPAEQSTHMPRGCDSDDCMQSPRDSSDQLEHSESRPGQRGPSPDDQRDLSPAASSSLSPPAATSQRASPTLAQTRRALKKTHPSRGSSYPVVHRMPGLDRTSLQGSAQQKLICENSMLQQQLSLRRAEVLMLNERIAKAEEGVAHDRNVWRERETMVLKMLHDRECAVKQAEARACALLQEAQLQYAAATPRAGGDAARRQLDLRGYSPGSAHETSPGEQRGKRASELAREVKHYAVKLKTLEHENTNLRSRLAARRKEVEMLREAMANEAQARLNAEEELASNRQAEAHRLKQRLKLFQDKENQIREEQMRAQVLRVLLESAQEQQQQARERERAVDQRELWVLDSERLLVECNGHLLRLPKEEAQHERERLEWERAREAWAREIEAGKERERKWDKKGEGWYTEREEAKEREKGWQESLEEARERGKAREEILLQTLREREVKREREREREKERERELRKMADTEAERERESTWLRAQEEERDREREGEGGGGGERECERVEREERQQDRLKRIVLHRLHCSASLLKVLKGPGL
jgi:hypothetical protein